MILETHSISKIVKRLLIINTGVYILTLITGLYTSSIRWFGLIPYKILHQFELWRLFTYLFLHGGPWHLVLNMFALWMFGPEIERRMGSRRFLFYYFFTGIGGGLFPLMLGHSAIGASASIFGLLVAFAIMFPNAIISLIFPPVAMKAKTFVIVFGVFQFIMLLGGGSGVAWEAHLGGMLFGYTYFAYSTKLREIRNRLSYLRKRRRKQFIEEEIDPILDKISKVGINGLSHRERRILRKYKMPV